MSSFILSTDSSSDYLKPDLDKNNVHCIPLQYLHNGISYDGLCDSDSGFRAFYEFIRRGNLPTTTQINVTVTEEYFTGLLGLADGDIVHLALSSGLSNTYDNAVAAAKSVMEKFKGRKIYVVDSLGATRVQGFLLDRGIKNRIKGMTALETYEDLTSTASRVNVILLPRDLFHLHRGGRVNKATAVVGSLLQIKPIIEFDKTGHLTVTDRVNGWTKGMRMMVKFALKNAADLSRDGAWIAHADAYEDAQELRAMLQSEVDCPVDIGWIGPVIGTHTGPGAMGLIILGSERKR